MVKLFVAVTDNNWFRFLRDQPALEEVNFWQPSGTRNFRALQSGELFLFKLHSPHNYIVGGGVFSHATNLPLTMAWEAFGIENGASSLAEMRSRIARYRREPADPKAEYQIGCRILVQPVFLEDSRWIAVPDSWSSNTVVGKTYDTDSADGRRLWDAFERALQQPQFVEGMQERQARFGNPTLIAPRLGQGAFRVAVTDAYGRRCAVTGEKVLPVLDAAHIKPYADGGEHSVSNGLLLRRDVHRLFDLGYVTVAPDHRFEVSSRIHDDFDNGRAYYAFHGHRIELPNQHDQKPRRDLLEWHNSDRYLG